MTNRNEDCGCKETTKTIFEQIDDQRKPYTEEIVDEHTKIRNFDPLYEDHLFKWHWDEETRYIEAINENDWSFQFDNELPQSLEPGKIILIPEGIIHRVIKGTTTLSIRINI